MRNHMIVRGLLLTAAVAALTPAAGLAQKGGRAPDVIGSDSMFLRVAGADRKMSREEFQVFLKERPATTRAGELPTFPDSVFTQLDSDKTGWLTRPEFAGVAQKVNFASAPAVAQGRGKGRGGQVAAAAQRRKLGRGNDSATSTPVADSVFVRAAGDDAKISPDELRNYLKDRPAATRMADPANFDRMFTRLDTNADGFLAKTEFAAAAKLLGNAVRLRKGGADTTVVPRKIKKGGA
jgi:hypothetical protein